MTLQQNPFQRATTKKRNLKMLLYGPSGSGKTTLTLQFPKPCVIDLEQGTTLYGGKHEFDVFSPKSMKELRQGISYLLTGGSASYQTLVIDPITVAWEMIQSEWTELFHLRQRKSPGHKGEFYTLQPGDWGTIKSAWKDLIRDLLALPLNVILVAREKPQYADGAFMVRVGQTFDGEKSLDYYMDLVVRTEKNYRARVEKNRGLNLPEEFSLSQWVVFENLLREQVPQEKVSIPPESRNPEEEKYPEPQAVLTTKVGFAKTGSLTWGDLLGGKKLPDGSCGKAYLRRLASWSDRPDVAATAKRFLDTLSLSQDNLFEERAPQANHYSQELDEAAGWQE